MKSEPKVLIQYVGSKPKPKGGDAAVRTGKAQAEYDKAQAKADRLQAAYNRTHSPDVLAQYEASLNELDAKQAELESARAAQAAGAVPAEPSPMAGAIDLSLRILDFSYEDTEKKTDLCKMAFDNRDLALFDDIVFEKGTILNVSWGYVGNMTPFHEVVVQKVRGALKLTIEAQDKGVLLNKKARTRTFENLARSDVARALAVENGYEDSRIHIEDTEIAYPVLTQASQTDAQFLKRLADQEGFEFFIDRDGFHWHSRKLDQAPLRVLQYYLPPNVGDIVNFDIENDVAGKPGAVTVKGRDPLKKQDFVHTASDSSTPRTTTATANEIPVVTVDGRTGEQRTGTTKATSAAATGASETRPTSEANAAGAKREANGIYRRTQQTSVVLTIDMVGDPGIEAKSIIDVQGLGQRLSGKYYVTEAIHSIGQNGYKLKLKTKSDGTNRAGATGASRTKPASAANPNKKDSPTTDDSGKLTPVITVDARTGEQKTGYYDTRGKKP